MKGRVSLFAAMLLVVAAVGCNEDIGAKSTPTPAGAVETEIGEVKAYKAKQAELEAQRLEDIKNGKVPKAQKTAKKR